MDKNSDTSINILEKVNQIVEYFKDKQIIKTELEYENPYQLLISVVLSAQCTDKRINIVSKNLYKRYKNFKELSEANFNELFELIKSITYPKDKTERIINISKIIHSKYNDNIPNDLNKLIEIPGIGRKTANLILSILYNYPGIAVDTHVTRVSNRLGLVNTQNADKIEKELSQIFSQEYFNKINPWFVIFGRYKCTAINPKCKDCKLINICKFKK